jgi:alpha-tubulin suppressor-like RCC1 family protein
LLGSKTPNGELGNGSNVQARSFLPQYRFLTGAATGLDSDGIYLSNISKLTGGYFFNCALSNQGYMYCWGDDPGGSLGNGAAGGQSVPDRVLAGAAVAADKNGSYLWNIKEISAGSQHTCAVSHAGNMYCWGDDDAAFQLGNGPLAGDQDVPGRVLAGEATGVDSDGTNLINMRDVGAGFRHTCAASNDGAVYCWGRGSAGSLGDGSGWVDQDSPVRVLAGEAAGVDSDDIYLANIQSVGAGTAHSCALTNDGSVYCWGWDGDGQIGNGAVTGDKYTPVRVVAGEAIGVDSDGVNLTNIRQLEVAGYQTCAVSYQDYLYCWGSDVRNQLGNGADGSQHSPTIVHYGEAVGVDVLGEHLANVNFVANGDGEQSCAVSKQGIPYCWGRGDRGQVGNGLTTDPDAPVRVHDGEAEFQRSFTIRSNTVSTGISTGVHSPKHFLMLLEEMQSTSGVMVGASSLLRTIEVWLHTKLGLEVVLVTRI